MKLSNAEDKRKRILYLGLLMAFFIGTSAVLAVVIWDPLKLNATIEIVEPSPPPTHDCRWIANVTSFNFNNIEPGQSSNLIPVHITNTEGTAILGVAPEWTVSNLTLVVYFPNMDPYIETTLTTGQSIDLLIGVEADLDAEPALINFKIKFYDY